MTSAFVLWACSLASAAVLTWSIDRGRPISVAFALAALGVAITATWPTQTSAGMLKPGEALRTSGLLHDVGSGLATLALFAAAILSLRSQDAARLRPLTLSVLALAITADLVLLLVGPSVAGVRERALVCAACVWQTALLLSSVKRSPSEEPACSCQARDTRGP